MELNDDDNIASALCSYVGVMVLVMMLFKGGQMPTSLKLSVG